MVADLDSDSSVPIDPYAFVLVAFLALQVLVVGMVLIWRIWKRDDHNSN